MKNEIKTELLLLPLLIYTICAMLFKGWRFINNPVITFFVSFIIFITYALVVAEFSGKGERYLIVFAPYMFLPAVWIFLKRLWIYPYFSLIILFTMSLSLEYKAFKKINTLLALIRTGIITMLIWVMLRWWPNIWILF